jgi:hypothetical protein
MRTSVLALMLLAAIPASAGQPKPDADGNVRVFVFAAKPAGGFVDADSKEREVAVRELSESLRKRPGIAIVASAEQADATLEVLFRGREETGEESRSAHGSRKDKMPTIRTRLTSGEYSKEIEAQYTQSDAGGLKFKIWGTVVGRIAKEVETWAMLNRQLILKQRVAPAPAAEASPAAQQ